MNWLMYLQSANLQVFFAYVSKAKFSLFNNAGENRGPTSHLADSQLISPSKHLMPIFFSGFPLLFLSKIRTFSLVILSKLSIFLFPFLFKLRDFLPAYFILAHGFPSQSPFLGWKIFCSKFSYLKFSYPWFYSSIFYQVKSFFTQVAIL